MDISEESHLLTKSYLNAAKKDENTLQREIFKQSSKQETRS